MDITISFRRIAPDDGLKRYVEEKLSRLKKYVESPLDLHVVLSLERKYRQRVDVMFTLNGVVINAHEVQGDMRAAVDAIVDKLETRLSRYRDKVKQYREGKPKYAPRGVEEQVPQIIMLRSIDAKPMDPEEARMQLTASGDGFIIFRDIERGNVCVMYKRKDGNFGLVETTGRAL
ncbi:MAG: ribosome-associated translation inhibitor RaiA [Syntrophorhabdales bacterium]|jgi:putative sigma-54 modulation protein